MSVKNQKLSKSSALSKTGAWEFNPDLWSNNNIHTPVRAHKKVNLRRGRNFTSSKSYTLSSRTETGLKSTCDVDSRKLDKKKLRNAKELENCRTARSHSAKSAKDSQPRKCQTAERTRSMSPTPSTPPLDAELPLRKFYSYSSKILDHIEIMKIFITRRGETAESLHELNRQRKRATEFAVRFSRNNLYQMKRIVNEIKQIIVPYPFDNLAKSDSEILCKKILLAYQTATQALQTYINYMKSGQSLDVPEKARELMLSILDLQLCCEHLSLPCDQVDLLGSCKELIATLDAKIVEAEGKQLVVRPSEKAKETEKEDRRFSMYKTKLAGSSWKKKTEALAKVKFGIPKLSYLKRMKKLEENAAVPRTTLEAYSQKRENTPRKTKNSKTVGNENAKAKKNATAPKKSHYTPREVTSQDDDIETAIQSIEEEDATLSNLRFPEAPDGDFNEDRSRCPNKNNVRKLLLQTIQEIQISDKCDVKNSLKKLLKSLDHQVQPRNVKLIHMISNEPIPEETEEEIVRDADGVEKNDESEIPKEDCKQATKEAKWKSIFQPISDSGHVSAEKLIKIPGETSSAIMKYKKMLCEYRRNNVMYKKGIKVRPCELVLRISDQIINDILFEISSGMENENLLNQLYYNELLEVA